MYQSTIIYNSIFIYAFCFVLLFAKINYNENYSVSLCQHHPFKGNNQMLIHGFLEFLFYHTFSKI